jgi:hypothetical protein
MAQARRYYRGPKKKSDTLGRLLIVLRSRHQVWIPCSTEDGAYIVGELYAQMAVAPKRYLDLKPYGITGFLLGESIEAVQYFPHKQAPSKESE